jgi:hypothetical protein
VKADVTYQDRIQELADRIDALTDARRTFVFAVLSRSLAPLFDLEGSVAEDWRTMLPEVLAIAEDVALGYPVRRESNELLLTLSARVPNADDLVELAEFYMLDAMVVVDGALRTASGGLGNGGLVEYALRPMHTYLCERDLGVLDIGSSNSEMEWEAQLVTDPDMAAALQFVGECISRAEETTRLTNEAISDAASGGRALIPPPR